MYLFTLNLLFSFLSHLCVIDSFIRCGLDMNALLSDDEKHTATAILLTFVSGMTALFGKLLYTCISIGSRSFSDISYLFFSYKRWCYRRVYWEAF